MCTPQEVARADDDRLIRLLRAGCDAVMAEIHHRHGRALQAHACRLLHGSPYDPEDAVQDTLLRAWATLRAHDRETQLAPWLHTVLRNRSLDLLRSAAARNVALDAFAMAGPRDAADEAIARDVVHRVADAIAALPPRQRDAIVGHAFAGESHTELAQRLETTPAAAKVLVHRARARLRHSVAP